MRRKQNLKVRQDIPVPLIAPSATEALEQQVLCCSSQEADRHILSQNVYT